MSRDERIGHWCVTVLCAAVLICIYTGLLQ